MKKVLILSGSPRKYGNSDTLANEFMRGALNGGNQVTKVNVCEKHINYCQGCYYCAESNGACMHDDDMAEILQQIIDTDVLVFASPVYFYSIDAQLKTLIDRTVARWTEVVNKEFYYIVTAGEDDETAVETTINCFRGYADCVEGAVEKGIIKGVGLNDKNDAKNNSVLMAQSYAMGASIK